MKHTTDNASQNQNVTGHDSGAFSEKHIEQWLLENYLECTTVAEQLKVLDEFPEQLDAMQRLRDRIADLFDRQRQLQQGESIVNIAVIGDFSSGKSTFINSLLGKELCPTSDKPTTSSITKFRYGDTISFRQTDENWQALKDNSNSGSLSWEKYMELAQHGDKKQSEGLYFECLCPTEELRNIALYDTPGFNNSDSIRGAHDTKLTQTMLESADVILLLVDINTGSIGADMVNKLRPLHAQSKKLYLILNKADLKAPSKRTAILTQCTNDFPYFEKTSWYSAIEELEGRKPKFAQQETQAPAHIFALEQERIGFTLTDKTKEAEPDFAEEFASLIENKDQEYHFIFSNAPTGNDTGFFLLRAEPAKRSENRQKLFEWFLDIKKEKEKLAQKAFYERCGEWSYQAKEVLQRLKTILRTISINSKSAQKTGIPFNEIEDIFKKWVNEQSSDLGLDKVLKQAIQKNIKCCEVPKSVKSYLVSPFWQLSINIDNVSEIVHSCLKEFFINAVYELASYLYHYNKEYSKQLKLNLSSYFKQDIQQITKSLKKSIEPDWAWVSWASNYLHYYDSKEDAEQALIKYRKELYSYDVNNWVQPFQDKLKSDCETMLLSALSPLREQNAQDHGYKRNKTEQAQKLLDHVNKALCIVDSLHPALENNRVII